MSIREKKIINAILFFALKSSDNTINRLKLMKLLWLADRMHLNKYGRLVLKDAYNALPHGPVPSLTMDFTKFSLPDIFRVAGYEITAEGEFDARYFSSSDIEIFEEVWSSFGELDQFSLRDLSHKFPEWLRYKDDLEDHNTPNSYGIVIEDFFNSPSGEKSYSHDDSRSEISKSVYREHNSLQNYLSE
ncbi:Panacea domain-containing protein [Plebeiibacterium sediminum]|uniref:Panacea domain-containing protein n=1 Tax=Plebeiibacterium sediminum TaxID=2992112 RepID=A0AAE3M281_9BACT|nr:Panacea domain-containing protein [Plebeiobacterium sediminum]MCW3785502.1 Panacea domain-containing protein [Plebeiobacterium sediminum]